MAYEVVFNDNYLCHFNKNHSSKNGQFVSGDGDGDGISNDHKNQKKKLSKGAKIGIGAGIGAAALLATTGAVMGISALKGNKRIENYQANADKMIQKYRSEAAATALKYNKLIESDREMNKLIDKMGKVLNK